MRLARKSVVSLSFVVAALSIWLVGCGPTNGLPALTGEYLYTANTDGTISEFSINTTSGLLTNVGLYPAVQLPVPDELNLAIDPNNEFIYVASVSTDALVGFDIGDGNFSGRIFTQNSNVSGLRPTVTTITPNGASLYSLSYPVSGPASLAEFSINLVPGTPTLPNEQNGDLTPIGNLTVPDYVGGLAVDASGGYAYVTQTPDILEYAIQSNGTLVANGTFPVSTNPDSDLFSIATTHPTPSTECAYAFDNNLQVVWEMAIDTSTGALSLVGNVPVSASFVPEIRPDPKQNFIYVTSGLPGTITVLAPSSKISKEGSIPCAMAQTSELLVDSNALVDVAVEPMGEFAYATDDEQHDVVELSIDQSTGALTQIGTIAAGNPASVNSEPEYPITTH
jgi:hypothetical protein